MLQKSVEENVRFDSIERMILLPDYKYDAKKQYRRNFASFSTPKKTNVKQVFRLNFEQRGCKNWGSSLLT